MKLKTTEKVTKSVSVGTCWFCDFKQAVDNPAKIIVIDGAFYVSCPKCGYEMQDALFLIGENV